MRRRDETPAMSQAAGKREDEKGGFRRLFVLSLLGPPAAGLLQQGVDQHAFPLGIPLSVLGKSGGQLPFEGV